MPVYVTESILLSGGRLGAESKLVLYQAAGLGVVYVSVCTCAFMVLQMHACVCMQ